MEGGFYLKKTPRTHQVDETQYDRATYLDILDEDLTGHLLNKITPVRNAPGSAKVIPEGHGFENRKAYKIGDIESLCSPDLRQRSRGLGVRLRRVDGRNKRWLFEAKGSSGTYVVKVKAFPRRKDITDPKKVDIKVSCSCPFWRWQGPEFHAKGKGYLLGKAVGTASKPDIKDPNREHGACKHILACLSVVKGMVVPGRGRKRASSWVLGDVWAVRDPGPVQRIVTRYYRKCLRDVQS
jgi:hypothetical protein